MKIVFRTDSSQVIGSGHVMRCLALVEELRISKGMEIIFICRELLGNMIDLIERKGFKVFHLPYVVDENKLQDKQNLYMSWLGVSLEQELGDIKQCLSYIGKIDWLIVDHYALDERWEKILRTFTNHIMVIDDLANRKHDCDLLLDQNYYTDMEKRYIELVPLKCCLLLGPRYALLRQEFIIARKKTKIRDGVVKRILVFMGGADLANVTGKALEALAKINFLGIIDVIVGSQNQFKDEIKNICKKNQNFNFYYQLGNISELMLKADLAIGAGGASTWERCCLGLPSLIITLAENQKKLAKDIQTIGATVCLGDNQISLDELAEKFKDNIYDYIKIQAMSKKSFSLVDGLGCQKVGKYVIV